MKSPATTDPAALPVPGPEADLDLTAPAAGTGTSGAGAGAGACAVVGAAAGKVKAAVKAAGRRARTSADGVPRPRADAVRNRERILTAARDVLVEFGPAAPLDEIARRAGVGNATLYRHFPDRPALIHHVVLFGLDRVHALAVDSLAEEPDAFAALRRFTHAAADERIGALCPVLASDFDHDHPELVASREALEESIEALLAAGRTSGLLRPDIGVGDLMIALSQLSRPLPGTACFDADVFVHRHLQLFLDGLMAPARSELPGSAITLADLRRKTM